jgi:hypothetical protein
LLLRVQLIQAVAEVAELVTVTVLAQQVRLQEEMAALELL